MPFSIKTSHMVGALGRAYLRLYEQLAVKPLPTLLHDVPPNIDSLLPYVYNKQPLPQVVGVADVPVIDGGDPKSAVVCFSGGKDSVATALRLRREGLDVRLLHVARINLYASKFEMDATAQLAAMLQMKTTVITVQQSGKMDYPENPIRNNLILALAADYMAPRGARVFSLGTMLSHHYDANNADVGLSDCVEVMDATAGALASSVNGLQLRHVLKSNTDAFTEVVNNAPETLPLIRSCLTRAMYHSVHRKRIKEKYGVELMPGRCGVCQKCASEWLHLLALGTVPENAGLEECFKNVLHRKYQANYIGRAAPLQEALNYFFDAGSCPAVARFTA